MRGLRTERVGVNCGSQTAVLETFNGWRFRLWWQCDDDDYDDLADAALPVVAGRGRLVDQALCCPTGSSKQQVARQACDGWPSGSYGGAEASTWRWGQLPVVLHAKCMLKCSFLVAAFRRSGILMILRSKSLLRRQGANWNDSSEKVAKFTDT